MCVCSSKDIVWSAKTAHACTLYSYSNIHKLCLCVHLMVAGDQCVQHANLLDWGVVSKYVRKATTSVTIDQLNLICTQYQLHNTKVKLCKKYCTVQ